MARQNKTPQWRRVHTLAPRPLERRASCTVVLPASVLHAVTGGSGDDIASIVPIPSQDPPPVYRG
jgi:hypothetical protein